MLATMMGLDSQTKATRATIADVARASGVTKGTVSRALNGGPGIAAATVQRVRRAADRLGYVPLGSAQAIRTGRSRALGLVLEADEPDAHRPFLSDFLAGLAEGAADRSWSLTVASAPKGRSAETYARLVAERKADGFVLPRTRDDDQRVRHLREAGVPFVLFGRHAETEGCAWFDIDGAAAMRVSVATLAARGHRRIGYVGGAAGYAYARLRREGFEAGLAEAGLQALPGGIVEDAIDGASGARAAGAMLDGPARPTAFVYAIDRAALGLWGACATRGLTVGRDVAVIGYDGDPLGASCEPGLATWSVDVNAAGRALADLAIRRVRGEAPEALRIVAPATFLDRGSAGSGAPESTGRRDS